MDLVIQLFRYTINNNDLRKDDKLYRQSELNDCFIRNIKNSIFSTIHVLLEKESDLEYYSSLIDTLSEKVKCNFIIFGKQPKYSDLVKYVKSSIENNKIVCIMNSDIFMGSTSIDFIKNELDYNTFISLTRHEYTNDNHSECNVNTCRLIYEYHGSHDAFIFKTPVPENYNYNFVDIPQNIGGSEAIFMRSWVDTGKYLKNLCFDIPIFHKHKHRFVTYQVLANHTLCNVKPTVPKDRPDIQSKMVQMF